MSAARPLLAHPPRPGELARLYHELAKLGAPSVGERRPWRYRPKGREGLVALAGEMLRYDPRLLTILLQFFLGHWHELDPLELRRQMKCMRWPQAILVVLGFVRLASVDSEIRYFVDYVSTGWPRVAPAERFFLDAEKPGSRVAERRLGRNLVPYARWGFLGAERPIVDPATKRTVGRYDARTRRDILSALVERRGEVTLSEYLAVVDHAIARQQALADLRQSPELEVVGHGRGARWRRRAGGTVEPSQARSDGPRPQPKA